MHRVGDLGDLLNGIAGAGLAQHRDAAGDVVAFDELDGLGKFGKPGLDRGTELSGILGLSRIVGRELNELVDVGQDGRGGGFVLAQKARLGGQEIAAGGALRAADLQQERRKLVLDLDRMHDPGVVLARLVDEHDRSRADRHQHQESRRKQQDLSNGAAPLGISRHNDLAS